MSRRPRSVQPLRDLLTSRVVADLPTIRAALGGVSEVTAFRYLRGVPHLCSYNHKGGYYALHEPARFDRLGLWTHGDAFFSTDGSLRATVRRHVHEAPAGMTHRELEERLRVRVHNTLRDLFAHREVAREPLVRVFVYLHPDRQVQAEQLRTRREQAAALVAAPGFDDLTAIRVLLVLVRFPDAHPADVVRRLWGHAPPIGTGQVRAIFTRYGIGEKGGPRIF